MEILRIEKIWFVIQKPSLPHFLQNRNMKYEPFGVKRSMRPF